jgi:bZIP transcription factor
MSQKKRALEMDEGDDSSGDDDTGNHGMKLKDSGNEDNESKRAERRAANRRSAFQSRQRRKILIEDLQKTVATLSKDNQELRNSNNQLLAKLETAMLENQLLRKQPGGASASTASDGAASSHLDSNVIEALSPRPTTVPVAAINTSSQNAVATFVASTTPSKESVPTPSPAILNSNQGVTSAFMGVNNSTSSQFRAASQGHSAASQVLIAANQGMSPHIFTALGGVGATALNAGANSDLAARLANLAGTGVGLGGINSVGNESGQEQQANHAMQALGATSGVAAASLGLGCGQLQQLAMLLGGAVGRTGPTADQGHQHLALLQAALGQANATPNPSISQLMFAQSGGQASQTTPRP